MGTEGKPAYYVFERIAKPTHLFIVDVIDLKELEKRRYETKYIFQKKEIMFRVDSYDSFSSDSANMSESSELSESHDVDFSPYHSGESDNESDSEDEGSGSSYYSDNSRYSDNSDHFVKKHMTKLKKDKAPIQNELIVEYNSDYSDNSDHFVKKRRSTKLPSEKYNSFYDPKIKFVGDTLMTFNGFEHNELKLKIFFHVNRQKLKQLIKEDHDQDPIFLLLSCLQFRNMRAIQYPQRIAKLSCETKQRLMHKFILSKMHSVKLEHVQINANNIFIKSFFDPLWEYLNIE